MNELIAINKSTLDDQQVETVNARELHYFCVAGEWVVNCSCTTCSG